LNGFVVAVRSEHAVHEGKTERFILEVVVNGIFIFADYALWLVQGVVTTFPKLNLQVKHLLLIEVAYKAVILFF
jgi:hypothetical protein